MTDSEMKLGFEAAVLRKENRELRRILYVVLNEITKAVEAAMTKTPKENSPDDH